MVLQTRAYLNTLPADLTTWTPPVNCTVYRRTLPRKKLTVEQIRAVLDGGLPVVAVLRVTNSFFSPDANGVVAEPPVDPYVGKHAVVAVGHGHLATTTYVLIRNSWGETWGVDGYAFLEKDYLDKRLIETAVIA